MMILITDPLGTASVALQKLVDSILGYAVLLAAVATVTMALLDLVKALPVLTVRLRYHRARVAKWIGDSTALNDLLILSVSGVESADALYDQPTDKMMGQIQSAANVAVDFPDLYPRIYDFLTKVPSSAAAAKETDGKSTTAGTTDAQVWRDYVRKSAGEPGPMEGSTSSRVTRCGRATFRRRPRRTLLGRRSEPALRLPPRTVARGRRVLPHRPRSHAMERDGPRLCLRR